MRLPFGLQAYAVGVTGLGVRLDAGGSTVVGAGDGPWLGAEEGRASVREEKRKEKKRPSSTRARHFGPVETLPVARSGMEGVGFVGV